MRTLRLWSASKAIEGKIGKLECEAFMSDDFPAYYNAWQMVMGPAQHRMLCIWHVSRAWRGHLLKIKDEKIRATLNGQLTSLKKCNDQAQFQIALAGFLSQTLGNEAKVFLITSGATMPSEQNSGRNVSERALRTPLTTIWRQCTTT